MFGMVEAGTIARFVLTAIAGIVGCCLPLLWRKHSVPVWGPMPAALPLALQRAGISVGDLQSVEINEAFASVSVAFTRKLGLDHSIVNVNGSGCSLGHPIGCTGARMIVTMVNELIRADAQWGAVAMCAAGGMGSATVIERV